jgi:hypothetical protein
MDRILRDAGGEATLATYDTNGVQADVDSTNVPTVVVTDSAGAAVGGFTPSRTGTGAYKATLPANLEVLDTYSLVWSWPNGQSRRTAFELVGGFLFTVADVQALGAPFATMSAATITAARAAVEDVFEDANITGRAFRPRGRRYITDGVSGSILPVPDYDLTRVVSGTIAGSAITVGNVVAHPWGSLELTSGSWAAIAGAVSVLYEFGLWPTPAKVRREAVNLAKSYLLSSPLEEGRATAVFTDIGGYRLSIAGRDGWTGIPSVDACLSQYSVVKAGLVG